VIVTLLGTGTSGGVPMIGCSCEVCASGDPRDKRLRSSIHIQTEDRSVVIDAGPDFRQQMLRERVDKLDAIVLTHQHRDHTAGFDDIRAYNFFQRKPIDVYLTSEVERAFVKEYHYVFDDHQYPGLPQMNLINMVNEPFYIGRSKWIPVEVLHYKLPVFGFRIGKFCYVTDCNRITEKEKVKMRNLDVLVLNALRKEPHISHFTLAEAVELIRELRPKQAYLTHISHQMGLHALVNQELPEGVELAYDGLRISVEE
jgi:phosphoribosyl 1,2-cyclic phosphate phosphodiesterase